MFSLRSETPVVRRIVFTVIAAVLIVNTAMVLWLGDHFLLGSYEKRDNDDVKYVYAAQMLLEKHTLVYNSGDKPTDFIMPTIPLMLSGFMLFLNRDEAVIAFRLLQCLMQAASMYLIFVITCAMLGTRTAVVAIILAAFYVPDLFAAGAILTDSTFKLVFLLLVCSTMYALQKKTPAPICGSASCSGCPAISSRSARFSRFACSSCGLSANTTGRIS